MDVKSLSLPYSLLGSQTLIFKKRRIGYIRRNVFLALVRGAHLCPTEINQMNQMVGYATLSIAFGDNANARRVTANKFALRSLNGIIL